MDVISIRVAQTCGSRKPLGCVGVVRRFSTNRPTRPPFCEPFDQAAGPGHSLALGACLPAAKYAKAWLVSATGRSSDLAGKAAGGQKLLAVVYADMVGYSRL